MARGPQSAIVRLGQSHARWSDELRFEGELIEYGYAFRKPARSPAYVISVACASKSLVN
jgi:hypothetical protein